MSDNGKTFYQLWIDVGLCGHGGSECLHESPHDLVTLALRECEWAGFTWDSENLCTVERNICGDPFVYIAKHDLDMLVVRVLAGLVYDIVGNRMSFSLSDDELLRVVNRVRLKEYQGYVIEARRRGLFVYDDIGPVGEVVEAGPIDPYDEEDLIVPLMCDDSVHVQCWVRADVETGFCHKTDENDPFKIGLVLSLGPETAGRSVGFVLVRGTIPRPLADFRFEDQFPQTLDKTG